MKTIKQIENEIVKLQKQKEELLEKENKDYQEIKFKKKIFRIYKWENKPIKDFKYPKGFKMSEFQEFNELIESGFKLELWKYYIVKNFNKLQWDKKWSLSRVYLYRYGGFYATYDVLADSDDFGRVVCVK